jgi:hypothetical protein
VASAFLEEVLVPIEGDVMKIRGQLHDALRDLSRKRKSVIDLTHDVTRLRRERDALVKRHCEHKFELERHYRKHDEQLRNRDILALRIKNEHNATVTEMNGCIATLQRKCEDCDRIREELAVSNRELVEIKQDKEDVLQSYKTSVRKKLKLELESHVRGVSSMLTNLTEPEIECANVCAEVSAPTTAATAHGSEDNGAVVSASTTASTPNASRESDVDDATESAGDYDYSSSDSG